MKEKACPCQIDTYDLGADVSYDILFLDVSMAQMDGIKLAKRIGEYDNHVYIVFVTAFID